MKGTEIKERERGGRGREKERNDVTSISEVIVPVRVNSSKFSWKWQRRINERKRTGKKNSAGKYARL